MDKPHLKMGVLAHVLN